MAATTQSPTGIQGPIRHLVVILGDQLDQDGAALDGVDPGQDLVWLCEAAEESTHVPTHKARLVLFLSAMRHFRDRLRGLGLAVRYRALDLESDPSLAAGLSADLLALRPQRVILTRPGERRVLEALSAACNRCGVALEVREDRHFICSGDDFRRWAGGRKRLVLEHFYRALRRREGILMHGDQPLGGVWSLDRENRKTFGRKGPGLVPVPLGFPPDATTREVMTLVQTRFPKAPGGLDRFDWPVTREQALAALDDFIRNRLPLFGPYQDAIWTGQPWLYHSRLSAAMNLKLLSPREVITAAVGALGRRDVPLASIEGFVRQILGWREYVRGIYWLEGPGYLERNALDARQPLPGLYWDAQTPAACLAECVGQVLEYGYGHHIQRLMVTGLFALLLGVEPKEVHAWYLGMYVDAVEWVEAPNTLGMSQHADGGLMASKPYAASGAYISRMSNHCDHCRFDPKAATGPTACPFTTLYWDFLLRHQARFSNHPRTALQWRQLERLDAATRAAIRHEADQLRARCAR
jgi:deoxyribodipyrimidine photolyase-related protein